MEFPDFEPESQQNQLLSQQNSIQLLPVTLLPPNYQNVFTEFTHFNAVQSQFLETLLETDQSVVVSAPTGSGKTVLFELAIIKLLLDVDNGVYGNIDDIKAVYISPLKSLCSEKYNAWKDKFVHIIGHELRVLEITGDTDQGQSSLQRVSDVHVIITTPEKWDAMTRKWRDCPAILNKIRLLMIDEVHLLAEESRGPVLEAVVSRMRTVQKSLRPNQPIRYLAVSATIPNIYDIAVWLGFGKPTVYAHIDDSFRPIKLTKIVRGFPPKPSQSTFQFEMFLSYKLKSVIMQYSDNKPTLIFCSTRKGVEHTCSILRQEMGISVTSEIREVVDQWAANIMDNKLKDFIRSSIGYHHAGMSLEDRTIIEQLFRCGYLLILVSTSSLVVRLYHNFTIGVNLPAHLVIIKSTENYVGASGYQEYKETQILQMIGRAGRPQYDTEGIAVILTKQQNQERYEKLVEGKEPVESSLHQHLVEHLNSEIVLKTISDVSVAVEWLRSTFFFVRVLSNPRHYGFQPGLSSEQLQTRLQDLCMRELNGLTRYNLITMNDGFDIQPTVNGSIMARFCIGYNTMVAFTALEGTEDMNALLQVFVKAQEFSDVRLRMNERGFLNYLNHNTGGAVIKYPMKGKIKTGPMKVNCLIQASLSCLNIKDYFLSQEAKKLLRVAQRVANGLLRYLQARHANHYQALLNAHILSVCTKIGLWDDSTYVCRQIPAIGPVLSSHLVAAEKTSFQAILDTNPRELERIINRHPPLGNKIQEFVQSLPHVSLSIYLVEELSPRIQVEIRLLNPDQAMAPYSLVLVVGDDLNEVRMDCVITNNKLNAGEPQCIVNIHLPSDAYSQVTTLEANLLNVDIIGLNAHAKLTLRSKPTGRINTPNLTTSTKIDQSKVNQSITKGAKKTLMKGNVTKSGVDKKKYDDDLSLGKGNRKRKHKLDSITKYLSINFKMGGMDKEKEKRVKEIERKLMDEEIDEENDKEIHNDVGDVERIEILDRTSLPQKGLQSIDWKHADLFNNNEIRSHENRNSERIHEKNIPYRSLQSKSWKHADLFDDNDIENNVENRTFSRQQTCSNHSVSNDEKIPRPSNDWRSLAMNRGKPSTSKTHFEDFNNNNDYGINGEEGDTSHQYNMGNRAEPNEMDRSSSVTTRTYNETDVDYYSNHCERLNSMAYIPNNVPSEVTHYRFRNRETPNRGPTSYCNTRPNKSNDVNLQLDQYFPTDEHLEREFHHCGNSCNTTKVEIYGDTNAAPRKFPLHYDPRTPSTETYASEAYQNDRSYNRTYSNEEIEAAKTGQPNGIGNNRSYNQTYENGRINATRTPWCGNSEPVQLDNPHQNYGHNEKDPQYSDQNHQHQDKTHRYKDESDGYKDNYDDLDEIAHCSYPEMEDACNDGIFKHNENISEMEKEEAHDQAETQEKIEEIQKWMSQTDENRSDEHVNYGTTSDEKYCRKPSAQKNNHVTGVHESACENDNIAEAGQRKGIHNLTFSSTSSDRLVIDFDRMSDSHLEQTEKSRWHPKDSVMSCQEISHRGSPFRENIPDSRENIENIPCDLRKNIPLKENKDERDFELCLYPESKDFQQSCHNHESHPPNDTTCTKRNDDLQNETCSVICRDDISNVNVIDAHATHQVVGKENTSQYNHETIQSCSGVEQVCKETRPDFVASNEIFTHIDIRPANISAGQLDLHHYDMVDNERNTPTNNSNKLIMTQADESLIEYQSDFSETRQCNDKQFDRKEPFLKSPMYSSENHMKKISHHNRLVKNKCEENMPKTQKELSDAGVEAMIVDANNQSIRKHYIGSELNNAPAVNNNKMVEIKRNKLDGIENGVQNSKLLETNVTLKLYLETNGQGVNNINNVLQTKATIPPIVDDNSNNVLDENHGMITVGFLNNTRSVPNSDATIEVVLTDSQRSSQLPIVNIQKYAINRSQTDLEEDGFDIIHAHDETILLRDNVAQNATETLDTPKETVGYITDEKTTKKISNFDDNLLDIHTNKDVSTDEKNNNKKFETECPMNADKEDNGNHNTKDQDNGERELNNVPISEISRINVITSNKDPLSCDVSDEHPVEIQPVVTTPIMEEPQNKTDKMETMEAKIVESVIAKNESLIKVSEITFTETTPNPCKNELPMNTDETHIENKENQNQNNISLIQPENTIHGGKGALEKCDKTTDDVNVIQYKGSLEECNELFDTPKNDIEKTTNGFEEIDPDPKSTFFKTDIGNIDKKSINEYAISNQQKGFNAEQQLHEENAFETTTTQKESKVRNTNNMTTIIDDAKLVKTFEIDTDHDTSKLEVLSAAPVDSKGPVKTIEVATNQDKSTIEDLFDTPDESKPSQSGDYRSIQKQKWDHKRKMKSIMLNQGGKSRNHLKATIERIRKDNKSRSLNQAQKTIKKRVNEIISTLENKVERHDEVDDEDETLDDKEKGDCASAKKSSSTNEKKSQNKFDHQKNITDATSQKMKDKINHDNHVQSRHDSENLSQRESEKSGIQQSPRGQKQNNNRKYDDVKLNIGELKNINSDVIEKNDRKVTETPKTAVMNYSMDENNTKCIDKDTSTVVKRNVQNEIQDNFKKPLERDSRKKKVLDGRNKIPVRFDVDLPTVDSDGERPVVTSSSDFKKKSQNSCQSQEQSYNPTEDKFRVQPKSVSNNVQGKSNAANLTREPKKVYKRRVKNEEPFCDAKYENHSNQTQSIVSEDKIETKASNGQVAEDKIRKVESSPSILKKPRRSTNVVGSVSAKPTDAEPCKISQYVYEAQDSRTFNVMTPNVTRKPISFDEMVLRTKALVDKSPMRRIGQERDVVGLDFIRTNILKLNTPKVSPRPTPLSSLITGSNDTPSSKNDSFNEGDYYHKKSSVIASQKVSRNSRITKLKGQDDTRLKEQEMEFGDIFEPDLDGEGPHMRRNPMGFSNQNRRTGMIRLNDDSEDYEDIELSEELNEEEDLFEDDDGHCENLEKSKYSDEGYNRRVNEDNQSSDGCRRPGSLSRQGSYMRTQDGVFKQSEGYWGKRNLQDNDRRNEKLFKYDGIGTESVDENNDEIDNDLMEEEEEVQKVGNHRSNTKYTNPFQTPRQLILSNTNFKNTKNNPVQNEGSAIRKESQSFKDQSNIGIAQDVTIVLNRDIDYFETDKNIFKTPVTRQQKSTNMQSTNDNLHKTDNNSWIENTTRCQDGNKLTQPVPRNNKPFSKVPSLTSSPNSIENGNREYTTKITGKGGHRIIEYKTSQSKIILNTINNEVKEKAKFNKTENVQKELIEAPEDSLKSFEGRGNFNKPMSYGTIHDKMGIRDNAYVGMSESDRPATILVPQEIVDRRDVNNRRGFGRDGSNDISKNFHSYIHSPYSNKGPLQNTNQMYDKLAGNRNSNSMGIVDQNFDMNIPNHLNKDFTKLGMSNSHDPIIPNQFRSSNQHTNYQFGNTNQHNNMHNFTNDTRNTYGYQKQQQPQNNCGYSQHCDQTDTNQNSPYSNHGNIEASANSAIAFEKCGDYKNQSTSFVENSYGVNIDSKLGEDQIKAELENNKELLNICMDCYNCYFECFCCQNMDSNNKLGKSDTHQEQEPQNSFGYPRSIDPKTNINPSHMDYNRGRSTNPNSSTNTYPAMSDTNHMNPLISNIPDPNVGNHGGSWSVNENNIRDIGQISTPKMNMNSTENYGTKQRGSFKMIGNNERVQYPGANSANDIILGNEYEEHPIYPKTLIPRGSSSMYGFDQNVPRNLPRPNNHGHNSYNLDENLGKFANRNFMKNLSIFPIVNNRSSFVGQNIQEQPSNRQFPVDNFTNILIKKDLYVDDFINQMQRSINGLSIIPIKEPFKGDSVLYSNVELNKNMNLIQMSNNDTISMLNFNREETPHMYRRKEANVNSNEAPDQAPFNNQTFNGANQTYNINNCNSKGSRSSNTLGSNFSFSNLQEGRQIRDHLRDRSLLQEPRYREESCDGNCASAYRAPLPNRSQRDIVTLTPVKDGTGTTKRSDQKREESYDKNDASSNRTPLPYRSQRNIVTLIPVKDDKRPTKRIVHTQSRVFDQYLPQNNDPCSRENYLAIRNLTVNSKEQYEFRKSDCIGAEMSRESGSLNRVNRVETSVYQSRENHPPDFQNCQTRSSSNCKDTQQLFMTTDHDRPLTSHRDEIEQKIQSSGNIIYPKRSVVNLSELVNSSHPFINGVHVSKVHRGETGRQKFVNMGDEQLDMSTDGVISLTELLRNNRIRNNCEEPFDEEEVIDEHNLAFDQNNYEENDFEDNIQETRPFIETPRQLCHERLTNETKPRQTYPDMFQTDENYDEDPYSTFSNDNRLTTETYEEDTCEHPIPRNNRNTLPDKYARSAPMYIPRSLERPQTLSTENSTRGRFRQHNFGSENLDTNSPQRKYDVNELQFQSKEMDIENIEEFSIDRCTKEFGRPTLEDNYHHGKTRYGIITGAQETQQTRGPQSIQTRSQQTKILQQSKVMQPAKVSASCQVTKPEYERQQFQVRHHQQKSIQQNGLNNHNRVSENRSSRKSGSQNHEPNSNCEPNIHFQTKLTRFQFEQKQLLPDENNHCLLGESYDDNEELNERILEEDDDDELGDQYDPEGICEDSDDSLTYDDFKNGVNFASSPI